MKVLIGKNKVSCSIGLAWQSDKEKKEPCSKLLVDGKAVQYGIGDADDVGVASLAAWAASEFLDAVVFSSVETEDGLRYWMVGVSEGLVLTDTDRFYDEDSLVVAIEDSLDLIGSPALYQLCSADMHTGSYQASGFELTSDSFGTGFLVSQPSSGKLLKVVLALIVLVGGAGTGFYVWQGNQDAAAKQLENSRRLSAKRIDDLADRNTLLSRNGVLNYINVFQEISGLPRLVRGWEFASARWEYGELMVIYKRIDGTILSFRDGLGDYTKDVTFSPSTPDSIVIKTLIEPLGMIKGNIPLYADIAEDFVSMTQEMEAGGASSTLVFNGGAELSPAISWSITFASVEMFLSNFYQYGLVVDTLVFKGGSWTVSGGFYAQ